MIRRLAVFALPIFITLVAVPRLAGASCGSECSCPVERPGGALDSRLLFDVEELYIDQNQPRVGTEDAAVGAIPEHHDEVRTVNRITRARLSYRLPAGWAFTATLPYVRRTHEHIHNHMGEAEYLRWNYSGLGDLELSAVRTIAPSSGPRFQVGLGLRAPTGDQSAALAEGDPIEPSARIGTGSWDLVANMGVEWRLHAPGKSDDRKMPVRISVAGRYNGRGVEDYRHGEELQAHLGTEYPVSKGIAALLQTNYRVRAKDDVGGSDDEESSNTGGTSLYLTPGLRLDALPGFSVYGLVQVPVYERVNGIQVVSESNLVLGISRSLF